MYAGSGISISQKSESEKPANRLPQWEEDKAGLGLTLPTLEGPTIARAAPLLQLEPTKTTV